MVADRADPGPAARSSAGPAASSSADSRFTISYFRTTPDGRIAFGAGVGAAGFGGRDRRDLHPRSASRGAGGRATFDSFFPTLARRPLEDAWGGPIDITGGPVPRDRLPARRARPFRPWLPGQRRRRRHAFAGRILAALVDDPQRPARPPADRRAAAQPFSARADPLSRRAAGARGADPPRTRRWMPAARRRPAGAAVARLPRLLGYRFGTEAGLAAS